MIITKTPYRISFFGGGSDYPEWFNKYYGEVISTTINKYLYISCRELPHFFKHKFRIVYSKIENVKTIHEIKHNGVKQLLNYLKVKNGLEIHYDGDLPSRSGMGSSSCFIVGLLNALSKSQNRQLNKKKLANMSIEIERNIMRENVGLQDQIAASYGGFNRIRFEKNNYKVNKIICSKSFKDDLNKKLFLLYTGKSRTAEKITRSYTNKLSQNKKKNVKKILDFVDQAKRIIKQNNSDDFGYLLNETWYQKRELSKLVSNTKIDYLYKKGISNGALGGKLLGAGGGGFLLFYVNSNKKKNFLKSFENNVIVPIELSNIGSEIIFNEK
jgi:D-glycero-alpha-D-manno-heptose-7-phosphate kinase